MQASDHAQRRTETHFNSTVAAIASRHEDVPARLLRILLDHARLPEPRSNRLRRPRAVTPRGHVDVYAEGQWTYRYFARDRAAEDAVELAPIRPDLNVAQLDWVFTSANLTVIAEVKISPTRRFGVDQMQFYRRLVKYNSYASPGRARRLVVAAPYIPTDAELGLPDTADVLVGVALWQDIHDHVAELVPESSPDREAWVEALSLIRI